MPIVAIPVVVIENVRPVFSITVGGRRINLFEFKVLANTRDATAHQFRCALRNAAPADSAFANVIPASATRSYPRTSPPSSRVHSIPLTYACRATYLHDPEGGTPAQCCTNMSLQLGWRKVWLFDCVTSA